MVTTPPRTRFPVPVPKLWGVNRPVDATAAYELHHASVDAGTHSSVHRHRRKWNLFYVLSGILEVRLFGDDEVPVFATVETITLGPTDTLRVPAGEWHQFRAATAVELIETYGGAVVSPEDIDRWPGTA